MLHTILQLLPHTRLVKLGRFEVNLIVKGCTVVKRELLVKALLPHPLLSLEWINPVYGKGYVRECYSIGAVSGILTMQGIYRNAERGTRPGLSKRDG